MDLGIVLDPMLATGGSAIAAIDILKKAGTPKVSFIGLLAAPEGVARCRRLTRTCRSSWQRLDSHLNEVGYIVPGLGDAGDRQFGTA
ncbi:MAG: uracil phosphoribosyltransferase [Gemmataceae bacterium]